MKNTDLRNLIIILLGFTAFPISGQELTTWDIDSIGTLKAHEILDAKRTNEVLIFNSGCVGCEVLYELCSCSDGHMKAYLIWRENHKTWLCQVNCCAEIETTELNSNIWNDLQLNKDRIFKSDFKEDYFTSHYGFWNLKVLPTFPKELRIYDYYFDEGYKYQNYNEKQYANEFRKILQKSISENGK
jgi:hypothetical protein